MQASSTFLLLPVFTNKNWYRFHTTERVIFLASNVQTKIHLVAKFLQRMKMNLNLHCKLLHKPSGFAYYVEES